MSTEENKAVARRFGGVWDASWSESLVDELAAPNLYVMYPLMPEPARSADEFKQVLRMVHTAFPDLKLGFDDTVAEGDRVAVRWTLSGTHKGDMMGIPATGKAVRWTGMTMYRIVDGKVVEEVGEEDGLGLLRQIGAIPS